VSQAGHAVARACLCLLIVVSLAACGGGSGPANRTATGQARARVFGPFGLSGSGKRPDITVGPIPPASSTADVGLPLDSYQLVASQQQDALAEANVILTQRCMTARGFDYPAAAPASSDAASLQALEVQPVGITSPAQAQTYGYQQPKGQSRPGFFFVGGGVALNIGRALQHHQQAWLSALLGIGIRARRGAVLPPGCLRVVAGELYRAGGNGFAGGEPVLTLAFQALQWTQTDSRIRAADRLWSRCMARRGFSYPSPAAAAGHHWPKSPSTAEIATASADVSCKMQANLPNTWLAVEAAYQQALITANLATLSQLQARFRALLNRAESLIRGNG
jgi:hypothetical protein